MALKICCEPGCPELVPVGTKRCDKHKTNAGGNTR